MDAWLAVEIRTAPFRFFFCSALGNVTLALALARVLSRHFVNPSFFPFVRSLTEVRSGRERLGRVTSILEYSCKTCDMSQNGLLIRLIA